MCVTQCERKRGRRLGGGRTPRRRLESCPQAGRRSLGGGDLGSQYEKFARNTEAATRNLPPAPEAAAGRRRS